MEFACIFGRILKCVYRFGGDEFLGMRKKKLKLKARQLHECVRSSATNHQTYLCLAPPQKDE